MLIDKLEKVGLALLAVLAPVRSIAIAMTALIIIDTFTALWKSKVKKEKITSNKFSHSINKLVLYNVAILASFIVETYLFKGVPWVSLVVSYIALTELKSIAENIFTVTNVNIIKKATAYLEELKNKKKEDKK